MWLLPGTTISCLLRWGLDRFMTDLYFKQSTLLRSALQVLLCVVVAMRLAASLLAQKNGVSCARTYACGLYVRPLDFAARAMR